MGKADTDWPDLGPCDPALATGSGLRSDCGGGEGKEVGGKPKPRPLAAGFLLSHGEAAGAPCGCWWTCFPPLSSFSLSSASPPDFHFMEIETGSFKNPFCLVVVLVVVVGDGWV